MVEAVRGYSFGSGTAKGGPSRISADGVRPCGVPEPVGACGRVENAATVGVGNRGTSVACSGPLVSKIEDGAVEFGPADEGKLCMTGHSGGALANTEDVFIGEADATTFKFAARVSLFCRSACAVPVADGGTLGPANERCEDEGFVDVSAGVDT